MDHDVFISHSSKDQSRALEVYDGLKVRGLKCWIACKDIPGGANYQTEIVNALSVAKVMILIFSANANSSPEIERELAIASQNGQVLIPLKIDDTKPSGAFTYNLATSQWVQIFPDFDNKLDEVTRTIQSITEKFSSYAQLVQDNLREDNILGETEKTYLISEGKKFGISEKQALVTIERISGFSATDYAKSESEYIELLKAVLADRVVSSIEKTALAAKAKELRISEQQAIVLLEKVRATTKSSDRSNGATPPNIVVCGNCGGQNSVGAKFCVQCGATLGGAALGKVPVAKPERAAEPSPPKVSQVAAFSATKEAAASPPAEPVSAPPPSPPPQAQAPKPEPASVPPQPPVQVAPPAPATPVGAPEAKKGSSGTGAIVGIVAVAAIGAGAYFALKPSAPPPAPALATPSAAPAANSAQGAAVKPVEAPAPQIASGPAQPAPAQAAGNPLQAMLEGAKTNNEAAISAAVEAIKQQPVPPKGDRKVARAANEAGLAALRSNNFDEAIAKLTDAVKADPSDQEVVNNLGYAQMMAGKLSEAQASFKSTLMLNPTRSPAWANLGYALAKEGKADDAYNAYLLTFKFSQNQSKTREFWKKQAAEDADPKVRELAERILQAVGPE